MGDVKARDSQFIVYFEHKTLKELTDLQKLLYKISHYKHKFPFNNYLHRSYGILFCYIHSKINLIESKYIHNYVIRFFQWVFL